VNKKQISPLAAFLAARVDYAVEGGVAVNAHGYLRATNDLNLFIRHRTSKVVIPKRSDGRTSLIFSKDKRGR